MRKPNDTKIVELTTNGQHIRTIQHDTVSNKLLFDTPVCICTNINGDIIVLDNRRKIVAINKSSTKRFIYNGKERNLKNLWSPQYVVTSRYGHIIISDHRNSVLHMLDKDGNFIEFLFTLDHGCCHPTGLAIDILGRLWD
ncbi:hypothetical protein KUTeg_008189 [Tegillarca granosa]|uniref:Tripartite motif-containing protein 2 n=1 Tax=Tegillarca granosa TaxID=220873 RepID=A0ABQ9F8F9_TEGGR|nr:hypothetical protein KUTeg_008189 [Tegillarca granosa]